MSWLYGRSWSVFGSQATFASSETCGLSKGKGLSSQPCHLLGSTPWTSWWSSILTVQWTFKFEIIGLKVMVKAAISLYYININHVESMSRHVHIDHPRSCKLLYQWAGLLFKQPRYIASHPFYAKPMYLQHKSPQFCTLTSPALLESVTSKCRPVTRLPSKILPLASKYFHDMA